MVQRIGTYGTDDNKKQRYRCTPKTGKRHDFTPELPRTFVHVGTEHCDHCEELRGVHHGDKSAARHTSWTGEQVFDVLADVAKGASYGKASRDARERAGRTTRRAKAPPDPNKRVSDGALESRRFWHTAADFTEIYAPILWKYQSEVLRKRDANLVSNSRKRKPPQPNVLVLDDIPVFGKRTRLGTKREWSVLAAAQVIHTQDPADGTWHKTTKLRLVRALPTNDTTAWKLFLTELDPYVPGFVVSDMASAQIAAVKALYPRAVIIPSLYHMRTNIEATLLRTSKCYTKKDREEKRLIQSLRNHMKLLRADNFTTMTQAHWDEWWDNLIGLLDGLNAPTNTIVRQRRTYDQHVPQLLKAFQKHPDVTLTTGGLELLLAERVKPLLKRRGHSFGNIERVNSLFDLVVCENNGLLNNKQQVLALLRNDNEDNYGWSLQPRAVSDTQPTFSGTTTVDEDGMERQRVKPSHYSSLRDITLLRQVARKQGLL